MRNFKKPALKSTSGKQSLFSLIMVEQINAFAGFLHTIESIFYKN